LSLLERQNKLLKDSGFSSSGSGGDGPRRSSAPPPSSGPTFRPSRGFRNRQNAALERMGMSNASSLSRKAEEVVFGDGEDERDSCGEADDDLKSVGGRSMMSHAPSLHPSIAQSTFSMACSEVTIGAGDNTGYWDFAHRTVTKNDLGHNCRECKLPFTRLGAAITERRGARTSMRYHAECFSGFADPRSQASSSMHVGRLANTQMEAAPQRKAGSKMRSSRHFEGGGSSRYQSGGGGKIAAFAGGSMGFGGKSSKGKVPEEVPGAKEHGGLSVAQLQEHTRRMELEEKEGGLALPVLNEEDQPNDDQTAVT